MNSICTLKKRICSKINNFSNCILPIFTIDLLSDMLDYMISSLIYCYSLNSAWNSILSKLDT